MSDTFSACDHVLSTIDSLVIPERWGDQAGMESEAYGKEEERALSCFDAEYGVSEGRTFAGPLHTGWVREGG